MNEEKNIWDFMILYTQTRSVYIWLVVDGNTEGDGEKVYII